MIKHAKWVMLIILLWTFSFIAPSLEALDVDTHSNINLRIAELDMDGFALDSLLKSQLGFKNGIDDVYDKYKVRQWLSLGGRYEDNPPWAILPYRRSVNHFHEPISKKGFSGFIDGSFLRGMSSVLWAEQPIGSQSPGGYYSWYDVRDYYYKALTSINETEKGKFYAQTFRGLGQLLHLVEDASVPAHTRDDAHLLLEYENWVKKNPRVLNVNPIFFDKAILSRNSADLPIGNIINTNQYDGTNPQVTAGNGIGLAEYTSANFFSEDTIKSSKIPYPQLDSTQIVERSHLSIFGDPYLRKYYYKNCCGETKGGAGYLLAAVDYWDYWRKKYKPVDIFPIIPVLDDNVYEDYASLLIPRAIGYSAGLLEYFFRGQLQVTAIPIYYKENLSNIRLRIQNMTPGETIRDGAFVVTYRYTPAGGKMDGSEDLFGQAWADPESIYAPSPELKEGDEVELDFIIFPALPRESYDSIRFMLAFKGTLGGEQGAVIGKSILPGEVVFNEDWNNGLTGSHAWAHSGINILDNSDNGSTGNVIVGDRLIKDNTRFDQEREARVNESFVSNLCCNGQFNDVLPIPITPNTYVMFKIDAMTINQIPLAPPGQTRQWQGLWLTFNNGLVLEFSQMGQYLLDNERTVAYPFNLGSNVFKNIYDLFRGGEITIPEPLYLEGISFLQQLDLREADNGEYHQHMEVDYIQIIEGKEQ